MAWLAELQGELLGAAVRQHRRRARRRRALAVASIVPLLVIAALALPRAGRAEASSVTVRPAAGGVEINLVDRSAPPRSIAEDLAAAGVVVALEEVSTGPSRVGRLLWLRAGTARSPEGDLFVAEGEAVWVGVGREAEPGATYELRTDAFAPGEQLRCVGFRGQPAVDLVLALTARPDLSVAWRSADGTATAVRPDDRRVVTSAEAVAADAIEVFVDVGPVPVDDPCR